MNSKLRMVADLGKIAARLSSIMDLETLGTAIGDIIDEIVEVEYYGLYLLEPGGDTLRLVGTKGFSKDELKRAQETAMDRHPGWVFKNKEKLLIRDTKQDESGHSRDSARSFVVRSRVWFPVVCKDKSVGACGMASTRVNQFSEEHIAFLSFVCDLAGVVYGNVLLTLAQEENENKLRAALKAEQNARAIKQDFLAKMSHEIRTPMNAIIGMTDLLAGTPLTEKQIAYLNAISVSSKNLLFLLNNILDLSKIEAEEFHLEHTDFQLDEVFEKSHLALKYKAQDKGLEFGFTMADGVPRLLKGDPFRLGQILMNLSSNAIKFTSTGEVQMTCSCLEDQPGRCKLRFAVRDTGIGIDPGNIGKIFERFRQEDNTTTRRFGGSGLGLAIVKEIVELYKGKVGVESEKGTGTNFFFEIEFEKGMTKEEKVVAEIDYGSVSLEGLRILLAEDDEINQFLAVTLLEGRKAEVDIAENGKVAVEKERAREYDIILMDMQMPEMDGLEATRILRNESRSTIPIIALTANAIEGDEERCLAAGMNGYISKPFTLEGLMSMILKHTGKVEAASKVFDTADEDDGRV